MSDLTFGAPLLLLLLLPAVLLPALLPRLWQKRMGPVGLRYSDTGLLMGSGWSLRLRAMPFVTALRILALALVIVAAARPQTTNAREVIRGEGVDIVIAIDISGSMGQTDFEPHRLGAAREIVADFIRDRRYDRIGLVVFSREAFIQSPPTPDHELLLRLLSDVHLADELGIEDGTALGSGMATAANMLKDSTAKSRVVTLITDGVNNAGNLDPVTAATAAGALGIRVYTIGVGSEGESVDSPLDEDTLRQVAAITNAKFYRAANVEGLRDIYADISALEKSEVETLEYIRHRELAGWLVAPALALLILELMLSNTIFRRMP